MHVLIDKTDKQLNYSLHYLQQLKNTKINESNINPYDEYIPKEISLEDSRALIK